MPVFFFHHLTYHKMWGKVLFSSKKVCLPMCLITQKQNVRFAWNLYCRYIRDAGWLSSNLGQIQKQGCQKFTKTADFNVFQMVLIFKKKNTKIIITRFIITWNKEYENRVARFLIIILYWFLLFFVSFQFIWIIYHSNCLYKYYKYCIMIDQTTGYFLNYLI